MCPFLLVLLLTLVLPLWGLCCELHLGLELLCHTGYSFFICDDTSLLIVPFDSKSALFGG